MMPDTTMDEAPTKYENKPLKRTAHKLFYFIIVIIFLIFISPGIYFYYQYQKTSNYLKLLNSSSINAPKDITDTVGRLIQLPIGETPEIVRITDANRAKEKPFLWKAENGDILFLYSKAKQAILYDPITNKIKEVGPLILPSPAATPSGTLN